MKLSHIPSPLATAKNFVGYNSIFPLLKRPLKPRTLVFYVTYRCNSRCFICNLWKTDPSRAIKYEITVKNLEGILNDSLFTHIEHFNINGGEPTLRKDIPLIVETVIKKLPRLKHITMSSNGLSLKKVTSTVTTISEMCKKNKIKYSLSVSIHGVNHMLEQVFGIKNAFTKVSHSIKTIKPILKKNKHTLSLNCVLTDINLLAANQLLDWSKQIGVNLNFVLGEIRERFQNSGEKAKISIQKDKKDDLIGFLKAFQNDKELFNPQAYRYYHLIRMIEANKPRTMACHYATGGVVLGAYGELYYCPHSKNIGDTINNPAHSVYFSEKNKNYFKNELLNNQCQICPPYTFNKYEFQKDLIKYLWFILFKGNKKF